MMSDKGIMVDRDLRDLRNNFNILVIKVEEDG